MNITSFALFGAKPTFDKPLPIGQLYFPSSERYEAKFRGIFERQYYNNNGPLHEELEEKLQQFLGVKHAICVSNATLGLMMLADAMELTGKVILPAFTFAASAHSVTWAGLEPVFCDINLDTHQIDINAIDALIDKDVSAIMGVNLWGGACNPKALAEVAAARGVKLYFDSAHAFGCTVDGTSIGNFGCAEVFSFHATKILSATEGGCICTNDDDLAVRLRSIRPSYSLDHPVSIVRVANARMSEAQAAIALMSLEDFPENQKNNETLYHLYAGKLNAISGLRLIRPAGVSFSNYQYLVCQVDEREFGLSRDMLIDILKAENVIARRYFYPGLHRCLPYAQELPQYLDSLPNTDSLCSSCIQLPIGALVSAQSVEHICDIIARTHQYAAEIRSRHEK
ncbi:dTDP-4-amino-4,6-dideoxy-D-glucose transaminase [mine drainage metagenome]|uniref:dTDP-4-amino-4,6-dideoxy-D-glucose transaminase n=1 Tax=mine drainage metagenome TaxID=410659 RepID=A0A1J5RZV1_9ZZZZ